MFCCTGHTNVDGMAVCHTCPAGSYCEGEGGTSHTTCPANYFCVEGYHEPEICTEGYFTTSTG